MISFERKNCPRIPNLERDLIERVILILEFELKITNKISEPNRFEWITIQLGNFYRQFMFKYGIEKKYITYQSQLNFLPDDQIAQTVDK